MIDFAKLPRRKTIAAAIARERNSVITHEQAFKIVCKRRGWDMRAVKILLAPKSNAGRPAGSKNKKKQPPVRRTLCKELPTREQLLADMAELGDLPREEAIDRLGRFYGMRNSFVSHQLNDSNQQCPPGTPTPDQLAEEMLAIQDGTHEGFQGKGKPWSKKVRRVRAGLGETRPVETQVSDFGTLSGRARTKLA